LDNEDIYFEAIDIRDFVGRRKGHVRRMRSRLIGTRGKARRTIEELSGADISVYGNTVSIIGDYFQLELARTAVTMLLRGSEHSTVYRFLEKRKKAEELEELTA
jgi:ribosomal RNA assembly protein